LRASHLWGEGAFSELERKIPRSYHTAGDRWAYSSTCNLYVFTPENGTLVETASIPDTACSSDFDEGGLTIDATETRVFIGDYAAGTIDVIAYDATTGTGSYSYSFKAAHASWSIAVSPVDSL
jgi:outer membrane protein assembly factor BamB